jgi:hypothetical protein
LLRRWRRFTEGLAGFLRGLHMLAFLLMMWSTIFMFGMWPKPSFISHETLFAIMLGAAWIMPTSYFFSLAFEKRGPLRDYRDTGYTGGRSQRLTWLGLNLVFWLFGYGMGGINAVIHFTPGGPENAFANMWLVDQCSAAQLQKGATSQPLLYMAKETATAAFHFLAEWFWPYEQPCIRPHPDNWYFWLWLKGWTTTISSGIMAALIRVVRMYW